MKQSGRYDTSKLVEDQFEPGSRDRVLRNLLGIRRKREMDQIEGREYVRALSEAVKIYGRDRCFNAEDVRRIHKIWLGSVYVWAGCYRRVNLLKGKFPFAPAREIPRLMAELEEGPLRRFTPCRFKSSDEIARAIATVHAELILIHPFRDGNGRAARILAVLMALQAGLPPLDFGGVKGKKRSVYFAAVQTSLSGDYERMVGVFREVIRRTLRTLPRKQIF